MEKKLYYRYENYARDRNNFVLREKMLYNPQVNSFLSKEEADAHFNVS